MNMQQGDFVEARGRPWLVVLSFLAMRPRSASFPVVNGGVAPIAALRSDEETAG
jgi:hypothetical protein